MEENVLNKVDDLVDTIKSSEEYQRYLVVSQKLASNKEIMDKIKTIKKLQKEIINLSSRGEDITSKDEEINTILEELNSFPIYVEYEELVDSLNYKYNYIKSSFEELIDKIVN